MINDNFQKYIIDKLNKSEEYIYKVFLYLKEIEEIKLKDSKLQEAIWNLCEAGEIVSNSSIEIECLEDK